MRRVVSVSLGSSTRDAKTFLRYRNHHFSIERIGTDGNIKKAIQLIHALDGQVAAFGLGGIDRYIYVAGRRFELASSRPLIAAAKKSPIVDGSGLKDTLERRAVEEIARGRLLSLRGTKTLLVSGVDRFGLAEALANAGCEITYGDLLFHVPILPIPLHSKRQLDIVGRLLAPLVTRLPISMLYPTGKKQTVNTPRHVRVFAANTLIAGDFHLIRRYMPMDMTGKVVLTNTVTKDDIVELSRRGVEMIITTTPKFKKTHAEDDNDNVNRIFATNVIEALIVAMVAKPPEKISRDDYLRYINILQLKPGVIDFRRPK